MSFRKLPQNFRGRDFVIGDIHGAYDLVMRAMDRVRFDQACDRLFLVGDLIDRGPNSTASVNLLKQGFVNSVLGNHEAMLLELYEEGRPTEKQVLGASMFNGLAWWRDVPESTRQDILDTIRPLPIAMETATRRGTVGFVHADVPIGLHWHDFTIALQNPVMRGRVAAVALWSRKRITEEYDAGVPGIDRVFIGHTIVRRPLRMGNVFAIDTGAFHGVNDPDRGFITIADLNARTGSFSPADIEKQADDPVLSIEAAEADQERPFSAHI